MASQVAKNAPCPCGSGKKYKNCCLPKEGHTKVTAPPAGVASATQGSRFTLLLILAVIAVGVVIYSNTLHAPFAFDDTIISEQRANRADKISLKSIVSRQRPVSYLSFDLNYSLGGNDPFGYHLFNISIHLLTAIILYFFIHSTLNLPSLKSRYGGVSRQVAAIASLLFVSHPVQTQAVTYIVQRMTSLAAMFYLLSLLAYARGRMAVGGKQISLYIGSGLAALLAFGSKQHTVTLPIVIIVYEFFFFQGLDFKRFKKKLGLLFSLFIVPLIAGILYTQNINWILQNYDQYNFSMGERLLTELRVIVYYMSLLLLPLPSRLNVDYDFPLSYSLFSPPTTIISLFIIIALIAAAVWLARRKPLFSFSLFWFLLTLVPESTILPLDIVFEHRLYLPSVGFFIIAALVLTECSACLFQEYRLKIELGVVVLLILLLGWGTYQRNKVWGSAISLWSDVVKKSPHKARPHNMLGKAYAAAGKTDKALEEIKQAVKFDPLSYLAFDNLGRLYLGEGLPDEAIKASRAALRLNPDFMPAHNTLGMAYNRKKMYDEAIKSCLKAVKVRTNYPPSYFKPNYAESYLNLALAYEGKGEYDGAIEALQKAGELLPHVASIPYRLGNAYLNLGNAYFNQGAYDKAKQAYQKALKLKPDLVSAYYNLGVMYFNRTQYEAAVEQYQKIIKIVPTHAPAYERLGLIYMDKLKNYKLALFNFKKALEFFKTDKAARLAKERIKKLAP